MARLTLTLPHTFIFFTDMRIRISDINYAGHLGNDRALSLIHEARARFFGQYGFTELNIDGIGLVIADCQIIFKSEGFFGDVCRIEVAVGDFESYGCDIYYRLTNLSTGKELARAKTGIVFFDYAAKTKMSVPLAFKQLFRGDAAGDL